MIAEIATKNGKRNTMPQHIWSKLTEGKSELKNSPHQSWTASVYLDGGGFWRFTIKTGETAYKWTGPPYYDCSQAKIRAIHWIKWIVTVEENLAKPIKTNSHD